ncbi:uncharacterized protein LOC121976501 [Zingiber officinale]|uniref:uncharacterized protein LOC121976501 n=1 Tax=Zingiber officinale TaxID=94328 RepID=UPI001C4B6AE0|nr:uncharacterized protein LOC121976501 [Zingiber officinale]XP_042384616.1 uncharacterized protein LOC121976501 [Zingiber officinale]
MPRVNTERLASNTSLTIGLGDATSEDVDADPNYHIAYGTVEVPAVGWSLGYRVYDREESTKGGTNPKSRSLGSDRFSCSKSNPLPSPTASKNKPPIIALPRANVQAASAYDGRSVRRPTQCRFFPKDKKKKRPAVSDAEPGSPKVSCVGKILSEKERCRLRRKEGRKKRGSWINMFRCIGHGGAGEGSVIESKVVSAQQGLDNLSLKGGAVLTKTKTGQGSASVDSCDSVKVPGLDAMKRLSSGRRAPSWGEEAELKAKIRRPVGPDE